LCWSSHFLTSCILSLPPLCQISLFLPSTKAFTLSLAIVLFFYNNLHINMCMYMHIQMCTYIYTCAT
jgi:hypothetical protein